MEVISRALTALLRIGLCLPLVFGPLGTESGLAAAQEPSPSPTATATFGNCDAGCNGQPCGPLREDGSPTATCVNFLNLGICGCWPNCSYRSHAGDPCGLPCPDGSVAGRCICPLGADMCYCQGSCPPTACAQCQCNGDRNGDGRVTIDEVLDAVHNALEGCPTPIQTP
jgi:hypothetical protein